MKVALAHEVAARVGALDGVAAVALGGSLARGRGDTSSDVDLGIYYDPAWPFSVEALRDLATELDDRHAPELVGFGDWGPGRAQGPDVALPAGPRAGHRPPPPVGGRLRRLRPPARKNRRCSCSVKSRSTSSHGV